MSAPLLEDVEVVSLSPALVVEDDPAMRERLAYVLSTLGCDEPQIAWADSVAAARSLLEQQHFGVALVDIGLPDGSGVDLIEWMNVHHRLVPAVVISAWRTEAVIFAALRAGAIGYLLKERDDLELSIALRSIEQGGAPIDPAIARRILGWVAAQLPAPPPPFDAPTLAPVALTPRERKILELVSQGMSNRDMAEALSISRLTVECHTKNIYRKLAVNSRTEAIYQGRRHGLLR
ncbi:MULTISPECIES: response regulator transcription factor [Variovorax]|uniref:Response regulator n=1 Tax=Variovorax paradoxus TaxID=34073 RepID=A0A5Q0M755_VARPD|nr:MULTISPECIES: response regulator transcription factor [Variovorax]QFZ84305.1 response regulator [Variovorax paradoxus]WPG35981.1 response regulator transcription factor [Variovorax boronicumulans]